MIEFSRLLKRWKLIVRGASKNREAFNAICGAFSALFAVLSLGAALWWPDVCWELSRERVGDCIVGFWVIVPPVFFWTDWVVFGQKLKSDDREVVTHTHDLGRNIWLALLALLAVLFKIHLPGTG